MTCQHLSNGNCLMASHLAGRMVSVTPSWCIHCSSVKPPQQVNVVTMSLAKTSTQARRSDVAEPVNDPRMEHRRQKIAEAVRRKLWLVSWLKLLRAPQDVGIGDTANRLIQQRKKSPIWIASDAHDAVKRLLAQCSCSKTEAVTRLNREYPY